MAFTDIGDAVTGEIATAAWGDAVRENFLLAGPHLIVRKPSDEGPISSTTFQADDHLIAPVGANEVWLFYWVLRMVGSPDLKFRWTFPASAVMATLNLIASNGAGTVFDFRQTTTTSPLDSGSVLGSSGSMSQGYTYTPMQTMFVNGANAGNFALEWAPNTAVNLTMKANSTLWGVKLA